MLCGTLRKPELSTSFYQQAIYSESSDKRKTLENIQHCQNEIIKSGSWKDT